MVLACPDRCPVIILNPDVILRWVTIGRKRIPLNAGATHKYPITIRRSHRAENTRQRAIHLINPTGCEPEHCCNHRLMLITRTSPAQRFPCPPKPEDRGRKGLVV